MNIFVEGLVDSERRTILKSVLSENKSYLACLDKDISPIEIYNRAYLNDNEYQDFIKKYPLYVEDIKKNTIYSKCHDEFHIIVNCNNINNNMLAKELEKYSLFGGNILITQFMEIVKSRYACYYGDKNVFENKLFGRIIDEFLMYSDFDDEKIIDFYQELFEKFKFNSFIYYVEPENVEEVVKKIDEKKVNLFLENLKKSKYGKINKVVNTEDLITYIKKHISIEKKIILNVFPNRCRFY